MAAVQKLAQHREAGELSYIFSLFTLSSFSEGVAENPSPVDDVYR